LPTVYWYQQRHKSQNPKQRGKHHQAWQRAVQALQADAFTATLPENELQRWLEWAEWMARQFHRSSSAVEGRNGYLSQMYHNGRGLTEKRLRALTVIHNYGLKRVDGTTAAMRLFGRKFPDLSSWLVVEMGVLPLQYVLFAWIPPYQSRCLFLSPHPNPLPVGEGVSSAYLVTLALP
jgi:hypothetical protein